ncbi:MAG: hypothetical protein KDA42_07875 [Planctomycetales bacterium]|nr:hypothetical protein [Planctomycetales bacterium]
MNEPPDDARPAEAPQVVRGPITDSPWFWALLFSLVALIALQIMARKYSLRQTQIEQQYQGRQWAHLEPESALREKGDVIAFSSSDEVVIDLRPLRLVAIALIALSGAMLLLRWRSEPSAGR